MYAASHSSTHYIALKCLLKVIEMKLIQSKSGTEGTLDSMQMTLHWVKKKANLQISSVNEKQLVKI